MANNDERVLFVNYCLVRNEWLCAAVIDECGSLLDNTLINMSVNSPKINEKWKYKNRHSQIYDSIFRLWQYIQSILVMSVKNWRLVVGKIGKIGHGEFKGNFLANIY